MGFTLKAAGEQTTFTTAPQSITLPSSYTTVAGDCIVVAFTMAGSNSPTGSGCGATWVTILAGNAPPTAALLIGYGCTAGGTSISLAGWAGSEAGTAAVTVFGGVQYSSNPITGSQVGFTSAGGAASVTTASLSYAAGEMIVGMGGSGNGANFFAASPAASWSNGATNNNAWVNSGQVRPTRLDYSIPTSGSSTTLTETLNTQGTSAPLYAIAAALLPAPTSGNMFLVL